MSFHPNDLLTDADLVAYEKNILTQFAQTDWHDLRSKALEDWLFPLLEGRGFDPSRLRTRHTNPTVFGYTSAVYASQDTASVNLATVLAGANDALLVGFTQPFRGIVLPMTDSVNSTVSTK